MTLLWLLGAGVMVNIAILSGQKMAASVSSSLVILGLSLGWINHSADNFVAYENGTKYHTRDCHAIQEAISNGDELVPYRSEARAKRAGLHPHVCVTGYLVKRRSKDTAAAPQANPIKNVSAYDNSTPPMPVSTAQRSDFKAFQ